MTTLLLAMLDNGFKR